MHNGVVGGFLEIRRRLLSELSDEAYNSVQSFHSDSAVSFALFLHHLPSMTERQPPETLLRALQATIATISRIQKEAGVTDLSLLNFVVSDGVTMLATRFVNHDNEAPASLYFAEGAAYERTGASHEAELVAARAATASAALRSEGPGAANARSKAVTGEGDYHLTYSGTESRVCLIASEPVTSSASEWTEVPRNTALVICREKDGLLTVVQAPLTCSGVHPRQDEIHRCLDSITGAAAIQTKVSALRLSAMGAPLRQSSSSGFLDLSRDSSGNGSALPAPPGEEAPSSISMLSSSLQAQASLLSVGKLEADTRAAENLLTGHRGAVTALCTHGDYLFSGATDATVKVWSLRKSCCIQTLLGHRDPIRRLAVAGEVLLSAGAKTVRVWSLSDFSSLAVVLAADLRGSMKALAAAEDGTVFIGGQDCLVKAYTEADITDTAADSPRSMVGEEIARTCIGVAEPPSLVSPSEHSHCASVTCLAVCGDFVCSGASDSTVKVWKRHTLEFVKTLRGHRGSVLALHAVGGLLLSGGRDHLIRAWDVETWVCRRTLV